MTSFLIEDNASDAELTVHAFQKYSRAKRIHIARDGAEALEFFHCTGIYADRNEEIQPKLILLDLSSRWSMDSIFCARFAPMHRAMFPLSS